MTTSFPLFELREEAEANTPLDDCVVPVDLDQRMSVPGHTRKNSG